MIWIIVSIAAFVLSITAAPAIVDRLALAIDRLPFVKRFNRWMNKSNPNE